MADAVHFGPAVSQAARGHHGSQAGHVARGRAGVGFRHVLAAAMTGAQSPRASASVGSGIQTAALHVPLQMPVQMAHPRWVEKPDSVLPAQSDAALSQAMSAEGVPQSWLRKRIDRALRDEEPCALGARVVPVDRGELPPQSERCGLIRQRRGGGAGRHPLHPAALRQCRQRCGVLAAAPLVLSGV